MEFMKKVEILVRVLQFMKKGSDFSREVLKGVDINNQKCRVYDNTLKQQVNILRRRFDNASAQVLYFAKCIF